MAMHLALPRIVHNRAFVDLFRSAGKPQGSEMAHEGREGDRVCLTLVIPSWVKLLNRVSQPISGRPEQGWSRCHRRQVVVASGGGSVQRPPALLLHGQRIPLICAERVGIES